MCTILLTDLIRPQFRKGRMCIVILVCKPFQLKAVYMHVVEIEEHTHMYYKQR